jgi:hypothetical protein
VSAELARLLLDTLRLGGAPPADLPSRWASSEVEARAPTLSAWIAFERGEQWLLRRLADTGALAGAPRVLLAALRRASREHAMAGMAVDSETAAVARTLEARGIPCILLKGPARRAAAALYPLADARRTSDVDVLVPADRAEDAWRLLVASGYAPMYASQPALARPGDSELWMGSRHHLRPLMRPGRAAVELHVSTSWELPADVAWKRNATGASEIEQEDGTLRVPSATELLWHALTHAMVSANQPRGPGAWLLRYWLDASAIMAAAEVDWSAIASRLGGPELPDGARARAWLSAAAQLAGAKTPASLAPDRAVPLQRLLAWRLWVFGRGSKATWQEKLLDEATRAESGLGLAPLVAGRSWPIHVRRRAATLLARGTYVAWRLSHR